MHGGDRELDAALILRSAEHFTELSIGRDGEPEGRDSHEDGHDGERGWLRLQWLRPTLSRTTFLEFESKR